MINPRYGKEDEPKAILEAAKQNHIRAVRVLKKLKETLPKDINVLYSFSYYSTDVTVHLYPDNTNRFSEKATREFIVWAIENHEKPQRLANEATGEIYYYFNSKDITDKTGTYHIEFIFNCSHPLNCQIRPVTKKITVYEAMCEDES